MTTTWNHCAYLKTLEHVSERPVRDQTSKSIHIFFQTLPEKGQPFQYQYEDPKTMENKMATLDVTGVAVLLEPDKPSQRLAFHTNLATYKLEIIRPIPAENAELPGMHKVCP
jgi:hypothetical protein